MGDQGVDGGGEARRSARVDAAGEARQAESERERRAKVIHAEGEAQAAGRLREAAETLKGHPMAMQMRFLQTLADIGAKNSTTIVFPVPIDLFSVFQQAVGAKVDERREDSRDRGRVLHPEPKQ